MPYPTPREILAAIRVLESLRRTIDAHDDKQARLNPSETSTQRQARWNESRIIERMASIDESLSELRRWSNDLQQRQVRSIRHGP